MSLDLYCKRCGEPWHWSSRSDDMNFQERQDFDNGVCCPSCKGKEIKERPFRAQLAEVLGDLLGDDIDGLASEMEDAEFMMGEDFWG